MPQPVAKGGDRVIGVDTHVILVPSPSGPIPTPMPLPFSGALEQNLSVTVVVEEQAVALVGSVAFNDPPHVPPGGTFQKPPTNMATVSAGSDTIIVEDKPIARAADPASCCNDPADQDTGHIIAISTVIAG